MIALKSLKKSHIEKIINDTNITPSTGGFLYYSFKDPSSYQWAASKELINRPTFYSVSAIFCQLDCLNDAEDEIDNLATQTQEEKEALDNIKPVHLRDYQKGARQEVEWKNGDEVEAYGKSYKYVGLDPFNENLCICLANRDDDPQCFSIDALKKPESPEEKEKRERLEAAYDLYCEWCVAMKHHKLSFEQFLECERDKAGVLAIVDKTNYRKEK